MWTITALLWLSWLVPVVLRSIRSPFVWVVCAGTHDHMTKVCVRLLIAACRCSRWLWVLVRGFVVELIHDVKTVDGLSKPWKWQVNCFLILTYSSLSAVVIVISVMFYSDGDHAHDHYMCVCLLCIISFLFVITAASCGSAYCVCLIAHRRASTFPTVNLSYFSPLVCFSLFFLSSYSPDVDGRVNKTTTRMVIGPKYNELRDWHHGVSARALNVVQ